mgnify:CR=1 FL=1
MKEIKGIIVPILTPMHEDETVNYEELVNQIERLIAAGVHGIFVFGTNGEGYILDEEEKAEIIRVAVKAVNGRVPVYAGTGCVSTRDTIRMSRKAKELGADVLSIITPSFACSQVSPPWKYTAYGGFIGPSAESSMEDPCTNAPAAIITWLSYPGMSQGSGST